MNGKRGKEAKGLDKIGERAVISALQAVAEICPYVKP
jgi:hypothetical protein